MNKRPAGLQLSGIKRMLLYALDRDCRCDRMVKRSIELWSRGGLFNKALAYVLWNHVRKRYGCNIYPGITVGKDLKVTEYQWILIGKTTVLGDHVVIYPGVDIIAKVTGDDARLARRERRHATIGSNVILGNNCTIIGPVTIGDDCIIDIGAVVTHDIPPHSIVSGINVIREKKRGG